MEELQLALTTARVDQRNFGLWINNWQIGQTLNALVTGQLPSGELVLRVAGQQITATADIPIQQGANLMLEVKQLQPVPTLRVLNPATSAASANVGATLQLIPGGGSSIASPSLARVAQALQAVTAGTALPASVAEPVTQLLRMVARVDRLAAPEGLAAALRGSGIFLEAGLGAAGSARNGLLQSDIKAGLFRALAGVDAALAKIDAAALRGGDATALLELKRELEGGLGRIILHQFNSQPAEAQPAARSWQLEIPVLHAGSYHSLRIELEQERGSGSGQAAGEDEEGRWRVRLQFSPPALGALDVSLRLAGDRLDLRIAAAREPVRALIDAGLPELQRALASRGITLQTTATAALVAESPAGDPASDDAQALDLRA